MKSRILFAAAATLAISACSQAEAPEAPATDAAGSAETAAAAAAIAAAPAKGEKPTKEFVVGKWGNDGDCALAIDLKADGTSDGPLGNWAYSDGVITFPEAPEMKITVTMAEDGKSMDSVNAQGGKHQMTRC